MKTAAIFLLFFIQFSYGQHNLENNSLFKEMVEIKDEMTRNYKLKDFYVIQLHSGNKQKAQKIKKDIEALLQNHRTPNTFQKEAVIVYETPNYKVWIGGFNTRLLADRFYLKIKEDYPNALILKPGLG